MTAAPKLHRHTGDEVEILNVRGPDVCTVAAGANSYRPQLRCAAPQPLRIGDTAAEPGSTNLVPKAVSSVDTIVVVQSLRTFGKDHGLSWHLKNRALISSKLLLSKLVIECGS